MRRGSRSGGHSPLLSSADDPVAPTAAAAAAADERERPSGSSMGGAGSAPAEDEASQFECHICLETAAEPTITQCGHLFCWACLYRWMDTGHNECPVCKAGVSSENVIPLYGRGRQRDPRESIPARPRGHRPTPAPTAVPGAQPGGVTFSAGIGFFPSLFGLQFQAFPSPRVPDNATPEEQHQAFLSKVLIVLAVLVLVSLLFF